MRLILPLATFTLSVFTIPVLGEENAATASGQTEPETAAKTSGKDTVPFKDADSKWDSEARQAALKVQLFLDQQGFGPGKIDGRWGGFSRKAAERWNASSGDSPISIKDDDSLDISKAATLDFSGDLLTTYNVTDADQEILGSLPETPEEKSKLKSLPYTSLMELVAEKFHADPDFIREINSLASNDDVKVGSELKVPNVRKPFIIADVMKLSNESDGKESGEEAATGKAKDADKDKQDLSVAILRDARVVEVRDKDKIIHSFPISPGANDNESPAGEWEVSSITWMPEFRWDKSMLEDGTRSDEAFFLPPGPNNPVGIVWIALSADGIGLHGTPFPDAIGRNRSHGCIRLSNWDALKLGSTLHAGIPVTIQ